MIVPEKNGPVMGHSFDTSSVGKRPCWSCDSEIEDLYSCSHCTVIQDFMKDENYFTSFELGYQLNIDLEALETHYYRLSRKFHPDYYQQKSTEEQAISLENTSLLTQAYRTLKDPQKRISYLISLVEGDHASKTEAPSDLFEEIFEIQEGIEEIKALAPEESEQRAELFETLSDARRTMEAYQNEAKKHLERLSAEWDFLEASRESDSFNEPQKKYLSEMKQILSHRAYVERVINNIQTAL